jgi:hypothetical protein
MGPEVDMEARAHARMMRSDANVVQSLRAKMRVARNFALCEVWGMTLVEFMKHRDINLTALASLLGKPVNTVHGWVSERRRPGWHDVALIEDKTDRLVTAADFVPRRRPETDAGVGLCSPTTAG